MGVAAARQANLFRSWCIRAGLHTSLPLPRVPQDRNANPASWTRYRGARAAMPYTLLVPPSPAGLTMKGVPYSVSI